MAVSIKVLGAGVILTTVLTIAGVVVLNESPNALAQDRVLADGVYTDQQASRGERVYRTVCESCHAPNLEGSEEGSVLIGEEFLGGWDGEVLAELMFLMMDTMPEENPGGLSEEEYTDVLAFLLQENGYPAGDELTTDLLEEILIEFQSE